MELNFKEQLLQELARVQAIEQQKICNIEKLKRKIETQQQIYNNIEDKIQYEIMQKANLTDCTFSKVHMKIMEEQNEFLNHIQNTFEQKNLIMKQQAASNYVMNNDEKSEEDLLLQESALKLKMFQEKFNYEEYESTMKQLDLENMEYINKTINDKEMLKNLKTDRKEAQEKFDNHLKICFEIQNAERSKLQKVLDVKKEYEEKRIAVKAELSAKEEILNNLKKEFKELENL